MLTRAEVLSEFGLPDRAEFHVEPAPVPGKVWGVMLTCDGHDPWILMLKVARSLVAKVRDVDPRLAERVEGAVEEVESRFDPRT